MIMISGKIGDGSVVTSRTGSLDNLDVDIASQGGISLPSSVGVPPSTPSGETFTYKSKVFIAGL